MTNNQTKDKRECLEIRYRQWLAFSLALGASAFIFMAMNGGRKTLPLSTIALVIFSFFVYVTTYLWNPIIRFCEDGIYHKRGNFFPWHLVRNIQPHRNKYGKVLGLELEINTDSPDCRYRSTLFEKINLDSLATSGRLRVLYFHTNPLDGRDKLEQHLQNMQRQYYLSAKNKGILYLKEGVREQIANLEEGLAELEMAYKSLVVPDIDYRQAKRSYVNGIKTLKQLGLPPYLSDVYQ